ncbi:hypothetical protein [Hymenobacter terrenus]|uniref:hypothetical protein n=1 Tax=Hymenobacter terrenus TaxID=1629124 RepID=UPI0006198563|nr:hypothetical protein [Hymenobacter terrenus]
MAALSETQLLINEHLRRRLETAGCVRGRFAVNGPSAQFTLTGEKANGQSVLFWDFDDRAFNRLVGDYLDVHYSDGSARLTIDLEVATGRGTYARTTQTQQAAAARAEKQQEVANKKQQLRDRTAYGPALAEKVAITLSRGQTLGYSHRDYCGMGFDYYQGHFRYGEVWEYELKPLRSFARRPEFEAWLANQSDASLARTEEKDPFYWDNQTITRQRLEEFIQQ